MRSSIITEAEKKIYEEFRGLINLSVDELEAWLQTDESKKVGVVKGTTSRKITDPDRQESVGHESGRIIVELLHMKQSKYTEADYTHMKKVIGYIKRHSARIPARQTIATSRWRYSLMNWGHDPLK